MLPEISKFLANPINIVVLGWLGIYLFFVFFVFFYKFFSLSSWIKKEERALETLLTSNMFPIDSSMKPCIEKSTVINKYSFDACIQAAKKKATNGLTFLSIVASTSPFIGLFGTVVGILTAFAGMQSVTTINMIAPAIADALIATAVGILAAVPAYTFHQILAKKVEDLLATLKMQRDVYLSK
ncbi:MotA/TolQ/ExbB proton channel family protein [Caminibacter pacificus]|uniref:Cell division and transport-associated protein TolQ n=1 Tax=Caminibacter pacificus TaxID=1424653 RepID=A0AAJ4RCN5_9BACT|nr:MotA/TolQ/ExbB proton channel family protein [Caminibacter pacificus]NPA87563.1 MotA/TolQ/ExbB proton channel family protein [Campylobacterota bacterium]QCI27900.1 MotA/TolQ/ExbB proton channel family protein [Caminibacter pacificus]ROR39922.1 cell division and transport-associated protein TolQ [Caminibacter pacificus]